ncbi:MAG: Holliday junction resolvase RuvX [Deltaproteobacteria bacterium]|nr:MAG: Holliday junction resolvase RuvX [Deltaproteobacteria bacterium]
MRIMGLDVGEKRIGVALSDQMGIIAQGLEVIERKGSETLKRLREIALRYDVQEVVIGLPLRADGSLGVQAQKVMAFAEELKAVLGLPVRLWDERFSTQQAERILLQADQSRRKRRRVRDKLAAAIILQGYLEARRHGDASR